MTQPILTRKGTVRRRPVPPVVELIGRHYLSQLPVRLGCRDGLIAAIEPLDEATPTDWWVAPALVDLQVNGFAGVDFQDPAISVEGLLAAVRGLRRAGCTRFLLTLVTDEWGRLLSKLERLRDLRQRSAEVSAAIAGWHIEGPFLSERPGYCGAHDPALMRDPDPERIRQLREAAGGDLVLLTLAPERTGAIEAVALAVSLGMRISLGHTDASAEIIAQAIAAGASGFTHFGNGCPQALDRHDNILWRVLETGRLTVSMIPDGMHVSPSLFRLAHRLLPSESVVYITDAMAAAGAPPGRYALGPMQLEVGADRVVRLPGQPYFAGSALRPVDGVWRAANMAEVPWQVAWRKFSHLPAEWLGLPCGLGSGKRADFCLLPMEESQGSSRLRVFVGGQECVPGA
jgi:N-acetylglucosamine-6-phosphate deacetylase